MELWRHWLMQLCKTPRPPLRAGRPPVRSSAPPPPPTLVINFAPEDQWLLEDHTLCELQRLFREHQQPEFHALMWRAFDPLLRRLTVAETRCASAEKLARYWCAEKVRRGQLVVPEHG